MKRVFFLLCLIILIFAGCKSTKPISGNAPVEAKSDATTGATKIDFSKQETWILGYFNPDQLTHYPYSTWYDQGFDEYQPKSEPINNLLDISKDNITIKVIMGTWCPDSRREVPRFMKIMGIWQFPKDKITFMGVDDEKQCPVGEYANLNIVRVPTFIFYKNNIEAGRIIENPVTSLEQDMVNILTGIKNK